MPSARLVAGCLAGLVAVLLTAPALGTDGARAVEARLRRPVALALAPNDDFVYVANRCGSISVIDIAAATLVQEVAVGRQLADLVHVQDRVFLAVDEEAHQVVQLEIERDQVRVARQCAVSPYPVSVLVDQSRQVAFVASLWSRRLSRVAWQGPELRVESVLDLPIAPRCQVLTPDQRHLIVADSFAGRLALIDIEAWQLVTIRSFPGHNIRGLACSPNGQMLAVAHQMLNDLARTEMNDVHWGLLMSNDLRWLRLDSLLSVEKDIYAGAHVQPLGEAGNATGDPSHLVIAEDGRVVVALGGVGQIAVGREADYSLYRIPAGKRPMDLALSRNGKRAFVANMLGDSVSIVDLDQRDALAEIPLGPPAELSLADRGELLFFDARLSHDSWMSCHSCHTDGHTNGGRNDNFSDGSFGAAKRVLTLLGCADTAPFAWKGSVPALQAQIRNSVTHTMQGDRPVTTAEAEALEAYMTTLVPPPSVDQLRGTVDAGATARGEALFRERGCVQCHAPPSYTTPEVYDVGLVDEKGNRHYNPPSLRGTSQRGPYFHDNRAERLEDVFRVHRHQLDEELTDAQLSDLVALLRSL